MRERLIPVHQERRVRLTDWRHWLESSTGLLYLIWYVRFGILIWLVVFYLVRGRELRYANAFLGLLIAFLVYIAVSGALGLRNPERFAGRHVKLLQVVIEIACYLAFFYLTHDLRSGMYFLLFPPLFVAVRFLPLAWSLGVLFGTMAGLAGVGIALTADFLAWDVLTIMIPREVFLVAMTVFYLVRQHPDIVSQVSESDSPLRNALGGLSDGVYVTDRERRLLFVNDSLQARHGPYLPFQTCASYFGCAGAQCGLDFAGEVADPAGDGRKRETVFTDQSGRAYQVEISSTLLPAEEMSGFSGAISLVRDVSAQRATERQLRGRAEELESQHARLLQTCYEMSRLLTGQVDLRRLMQFVVDETRARLSAETSALFLLEDGQLVRKAAAGVGNDWFPEESYAVGQGLTGLAVQPADGSPYGKPIRSNNVREDARTVPSHLEAYEAVLATRRVQHLIAVPLNGVSRSTGVLRVVNRLSAPGVLAEDGFRKEDEEFLVTLASMVAIAVENARLFARQEREGALLRDLTRWSSHLIAHTDQQALYDACVRGGAAIFDVEDCSLLLLNEDRSTVDLVASSGVPPHVWSGRELRRDGPGLTAYVVRTGETLNFGDNEYREHPAWGGHAGPPFTAHLAYLPSRRCHSVMSTPIVDAAGQCIGVLKVENRQGRGAGQRFPEFEVAIFKTYALQVGLAIERARLFARLDEEAERRTRESIADEVHESLSLVHGLIHLKTGLARALLERGDYAGVREQLDMIDKGALSLKADLRSTYMEVRHPALEEGLLSALQRSADSLGLRLSVSLQGREPLPYPVEHARYKIGQEALTNAKRHAGLRPDDVVEIMLSRASTGYELRIRDPGRGFDAEAARQHPESFGLQGMERRARAINAQLEIASEAGKGTQVRVYGRWPCTAP